MNDPRKAADALGELLEKYAAAGGRIRVEDLLSAAAAVTGEACIGAAGEFDRGHHDFTPGSVVMSDSVNMVLSNDSTTWVAAGGSVFGLIHEAALANGYASKEFPKLGDIYRSFASGIGAKEGPGWGFVPLSVPPDNRPLVQPLRAAYELRTPVDTLLRKHGVETGDRPGVCALTLVAELARVRDAIDHTIALQLVFETVNGMAKTAPMTDNAFREASG